MSKLRYGRYSPTTGGHAPNHLRDAFIDSLDLFESWKTGEPEPLIEIDGHAIRISAVCGLVWNCTDILPGAARTAIEDLLEERGEGTRFRGTYAAGARALRPMIADALAS